MTFQVVSPEEYYGTREPVAQPEAQPQRTQGLSVSSGLGASPQSAKSSSFGGFVVVSPEEYNTMEGQKIPESVSSMEEAPIENEGSVWSDIPKSLVRSLDAAGESLGGAMVMAHIPGGEYVKDLYGERARRPEIAKPEYLQEGNIIDHPERWVDPRWWVNIAGENAANMALMMAPGAAGYRAAKAIGLGVKGVKAAATGGAISGAFALEAGSAYNDAKQEMMESGVPEDKADDVARKEGLVVGTINAAIEAAPFSILLSNPGSKKLLGRIVRQAIWEGSTEGVQENVQMLAAKFGHDQDLTAQQWLGRTIEAAVAGAVLGGPAGVFEGGTDITQDKQTPKPTSQEEAFLDDIEQRLNSPEDKVITPETVQGMMQDDRFAKVKPQLQEILDRSLESQVVTTEPEPVAPAAPGQPIDLLEDQQSPIPTEPPSGPPASGLTRTTRPSLTPGFQGPVQVNPRSGGWAYQETPATGPQGEVQPAQYDYSQQLDKFGKLPDQPILIDPNGPTEKQSPIYTPSDAGVKEEDNRDFLDKAAERLGGKVRQEIKEKPTQPIGKRTAMDQLKIDLLGKKSRFRPQSEATPEELKQQKELAKSLNWVLKDKNGEPTYLTDDGMKALYREAKNRGLNITEDLEDIPPASTKQIEDEAFKRGIVPITDPSGKIIGANIPQGEVVPKRETAANVKKASEQIRAELSGEEIPVKEAQPVKEPISGEAVAQGEVKKVKARTSYTEPDTTTAETAFYSKSKARDNTFYRGINEEELNNIISTGNIKSSSEMARILKKQNHEGMTFYSDVPNVATSYVKDKGYVVELIPSAELEKEGEGEYQTNKALPASDIKRIFEIGKDEEGIYSIDVTDKFFSKQAPPPVKESLTTAKEPAPEVKEKQVEAKPAPAAEKAKKVVTPEELKAKEAPDTNKQVSGIQDVGEKLGGARKDLARQLSTDISDDEIISQPLSKIWPKPKAEELDNDFVSAFIVAARAEVPAKPRAKFKVKAWASKVSFFRDFAKKLSSGEIREERLIEKLQETSTLKDFKNKLEVYRNVDKSVWDKIDRVYNFPTAYKYGENNEHIPDPQVSVNGKTYRYKEDVREVAKQIESDLSGKEDVEKKLQFEIRGTDRSGYFINKKGDPEYSKLKQFKTLNEAREYKKNNYGELVTAWDDLKSQVNIHEEDVRGTENRERSGKDHRGGKDVEAEEFRNTFGFRGVEFGNWVKQGGNLKDRQGMINAAYDALHDLSSILGIPPKAISLNGTLGLGLGSRGSGKASAHYEPDKLVINLTKTRGAGTLAHEWFHALDNFFQLKRGKEGVSREKSFITYRPEGYYKDSKSGYTLPESRFNEINVNNPSDWNKVEGVRPEVETQFANLVKVLDESGMAKRSAKADKGRQGYWSRIIERAARAFENYIINKMEDEGYHNDYLANVLLVDAFNKDSARFPYLTKDELKPVKDAFDDLFKTIETKETDKGVTLFNFGTPIINSDTFRDHRKAVGQFRKWMRTAGLSKEELAKTDIEIREVVKIMGDIRRSMKEHGKTEADLSKVLGSTTFFSDMTQLVQFTSNMDLIDFEKTTYHETFHVILNRLVSDQNRTALLDHYKGNEEDAAKDFATFVMGQETTSIPKAIRRIFYQIKKILTRIGNGFKASEYKTPEDFFKAIYFGANLKGIQAKGERTALQINAGLGNSVEGELIFQSETKTFIGDNGNEYIGVDASDHLDLLSDKEFQKITGRSKKQFSNQGGSIYFIPGNESIANSIHEISGEIVLSDKLKDNKTELHKKLVHELTHWGQIQRGEAPKAYYVSPEESIRDYMEYLADPAEVKARFNEEGKSDQEYENFMEQLDWAKSDDITELKNVDIGEIKIENQKGWRMTPSYIKQEIDIVKKGGDRDYLLYYPSGSRPRLQRDIKELENIINSPSTGKEIATKEGIHSQLDIIQNRIPLSDTNISNINGLLSTIRSKWTYRRLQFGDRKLRADEIEYYNKPVMRIEVNGKIDSKTGKRKNINPIIVEGLLRDKTGIRGVAVSPNEIDIDLEGSNLDNLKKLQKTMGGFKMLSSPASIEEESPNGITKFNLEDDSLEAMLKKYGFSDEAVQEVNKAENDATGPLTQESMSEAAKQGRRAVGGFRKGTVRAAMEKLHGVQLADDMRWYHRAFETPYVLAKKFKNSMGKMLKTELDAQEERSQMLVDDYSEGLSDFQDQMRKDPKALKELEGLIWKWDRKRFPKEAVPTDWLNKEKLDDEGELSINEKHYTEARKYLKDQGVSDKVADGFMLMRRKYDDKFIDAYHTMMTEKTDPGFIEQFRSDIGKINNYFPHVREGDSYIQVLKKGEQDPKKKVVYREHFWRAKEAVLPKNQMAAARARDWINEAIKSGELEGKASDYFVSRAKELTSLPQEIFHQVPIEDMQQILNEAGRRMEDARAGYEADRLYNEKGKTKEEALEIAKKRLNADMEEAISKAVAETFKTVGWGRHSILSKNIAGFKREDVFNTMFEYLSGYAGFKTKMKRAREHHKVLVDIDAKAHPNEYQYCSDYVKDMLANGDRTDRVVDTLRGIMFAKYLGFVFKSGFVNLTQNVVVAQPVLSAFTKHSAAKLSKAMYDTKKALMSKEAWMGKPIKYSSLKANELEALRNFHEKGASQDLYLREMKGAIPRSGWGKYYQKALDKAGVFMAVAERFNRSSTGLAAFRVAFNEGVQFEGQNTKGDQGLSEDFARKIIYDSHFLYGKSNLPSAFRGGKVRKLLRAGYTFRSFSHNYMDLMAHAVLNQGSAGRKVAAKSVRNLLLVGGLTAVPFFELLSKAIMAGLGKDDEDLITKARGAMPNQFMKDFIVYGLPGAVAGVDLTGSISMEIPRSWGDILGVPYSIGEDTLNMIENIQSGQTWRGLAASPITPMILRNAWRGLELYNEGQITKSGKVVNFAGEKGPKKITGAEAIKKGVFGFQPTSVTSGYKAYQASINMKQKLQDRKSEWANRFVNAKRRGDKDEMKAIRKEIFEWNKAAISDKKPWKKVNINAMIKSRLSEDNMRGIPKGQRQEVKRISNIWKGE